MSSNTGKTSIDIDNFKELYGLYFESLCKYLNFYTKDVYIIEDIVQEVFMKLWENKDVLDIVQFKSYLFRTAKNRVLNYQRDKQNRFHLLEKWIEEQIDISNDDKEAPQIDELVKMAFTAIDKLPPKCKEIFLLSKKDNLTYKQIAEQKQISIKTVENQMGIALKKIREYLFSLSIYRYFLFF